MPFCRRCGELAHSQKCTRCGNVIQDTKDANSSKSSVDRWKKSYMESVIGLDALLLSDTEKPALRSSSSTPLVSSSTLSPSPSSNLHIRFRPPRASSSFLESKKKVGPTPSLGGQKTSSIDKGNCAECGAPLRGKTVRLPNTHTRYHWGCLTCAQCREPFQNTSFHADVHGKIYHPKCHSLLQNDPKSCGRCSSDIRGAYLVIHHTAIHPQCFRCTACKKLLPPSTLYTDTATSAYCQPCGKTLVGTTSAHNRIVPQPQAPRFTMTPSVSTPTMDITTDQIKPSSLMSRRVTPLPRFGTRTVCAGCTQAIVSVHEERQGPRATRWHPKCLCCQGCAKILDSAAVVHENATTGGLDPWCRLCLLAKNKQQHRPQKALHMPVVSTRVTP